MSPGHHVSPIRQSRPCRQNYLPAPFSVLVDTLDIQLVYLANLATMILIKLLYWRFDNLLRTISEIVTRRIVLAIRKREKQDKKAGWFRAKSTTIKWQAPQQASAAAPTGPGQFRLQDLAHQAALSAALNLVLFPVG
jgi:hypothetical protein